MHNITRKKSRLVQMIPINPLRIKIEEKSKRKINGTSSYRKLNKNINEETPHRLNTRLSKLKIHMTVKMLSQTQGK